MNNITSHNPCNNGDKARFRQKFHKGNYSKWLSGSKLYPCDHQVTLKIEGCNDDDNCLHCLHTSPAKKSPKDYWLFKHKSHFPPTRNSISPKNSSILTTHVSLSTEALISPYLLKGESLHRDKKFVKHKKSMQQRYQHQQGQQLPPQLPQQHNSNIFTFPTFLSSNINNNHNIKNRNNNNNKNNNNDDDKNSNFKTYLSHPLVSTLLLGNLHAHNINNNKYHNNNKHNNKNNDVKYTVIKEPLSSRPCSAPYHRQLTPGVNHKNTTLPPVSPRVFTFDDLHNSASFLDVNEGNNKNNNNNNNNNNEGCATLSPLTPTTYIRHKLHASTINDDTTSFTNKTSNNTSNGSNSSISRSSIISNGVSRSVAMDVDGEVKVYDEVKTISQPPVATSIVTTAATNLNISTSSTFSVSTFQQFQSFSSFAATKSLSTSTKSPSEIAKVHQCGVCDKLFSRSDMLTRHMRLHNNQRPYKCHVCLQVFSRSDHLQTHLRTHTGEKPYRCHACSYAAPRRDMVTRHLRVHTKDSKRGGRYTVLEGYNVEDAKSSKVVKNSKGSRGYNRKRDAGKKDGCVRDGGQKNGGVGEDCKDEKAKSCENISVVNCKYKDKRNEVFTTSVGVSVMSHEGKDIKKENNQNESNIFSSINSNVNKNGMKSSSATFNCNNMLSPSYKPQQKLVNTHYHHLPLDLTNKSTYNSQQNNTNLISALNNTCHSLESIQSLSSNPSPQSTNQSQLNTPIFVPNFHNNLSHCDQNNLKMYSKQAHNLSQPLSNSHLSFVWPVVTEPCIRADHK